MARKPTYEELETRVTELETQVVESKRVEETLQINEERYRLLVETMNDGLGVQDKNGLLRFVNDRTCKMLGYSRDELIGQPVTAFLDDTNQKILKEQMARRKKGESGFYEIAWTAKDGRKIQTIVSAEPIRDRNGKYDGSFAVVTDITERKRAEEALRKSEEKLRTFMDSVTDFFAVTDRNENLMYVNKSMAEGLGYSKEEMIGMHITEIISEESMVNFEPELKALVEKGKLSIESTWLTRDGRKIQGELNVNAIYHAQGDYMGSRGVFRDITKRKQTEEALQMAHNELERRVEERTGELVKLNKRLKAEIEEREGAQEALREREIRFKALYQSIPIPVYIWQKMGEDFVLANYNDAGKAMTGGGIVDYVGRRASEMYGDRPEILEDFSRCFDEKTSIRREMPYRLMTTGESKYWNVWYGFVPPDSILVHTEDITERKLAEEALRESEKKYRDLVDNSLVGIYRSNVQGDFLYGNKALARMLEFESPEEMMSEGVLTTYKKPVDREALIESLRKRGKLDNFELELVTKTGKTRNVLLSTVLDGDTMSGMLMDITERKLTEKALRESEEKFRSLAEQSPNMIFINKGGKVVYANRMCEEVMGYTREEFYSPDFDFRVLIAPESAKMVELAFEKHMMGEDVNPYEFALVTKDGKRIEAIIGPKLVPFQGENAILGVVTDITDRKRAEEELKAEKEFTETALNAQTDTFFVFEASTGRAVRWNKAFKEISGYSDKEIRLMKAPDSYYNEEDLKKAAAAAGKVLNEGTGTVELALITKDGRSIPTEYTGSVIKDNENNPKYIIAIGRDISERKEAEEALRESQARYRAIVEDQTELICRFLPDGTLTFVNEAYCRYFGKDRKDLIGHSFVPLVLGEDRPKVQKHLDSLTPENPVMTHEHRVVGDEGGVYWQRWTNRMLLDEEGCIVEFQSVGRDITDRKQAEESLRNSEEQYRDLFENANDLIQSVAPDGRFLHVNKKWHETLGYSKGELADLRIWDVIHPDSRPHCEKVFQKVLSGHSVTFVDAVFVSKKGDLIPVEGNANARFEDGKPVSTRGIFRDITERKRVEEETKRLRFQLERAQRLETIGTLAGGIAHDFNNLLMGIQGNVSLMFMDTKSTHPHHQRLQSIEHLVHSGAKLTAHLLGYARKGKYDIKLIDLNKMIRDTSETFGRTRKDITIRHKLAKDLYSIEADYAQIEQVLLNLFVNAGDAMPGGGDLALKSGNVTHGDMKGKLYDPKHGNYVLLTVTDTGMGMDRETTERIFDPFFTTKEMGRGTGLGLASAYGIVKAHGGYLDVESEKGQGTTFSVYLPASGRRVQEAAKTPERAVKGAGTVLLVDDEEVILGVSRDLLEAMGYYVLTAKGGKEAVRVYKESQDEIDIVVMDMVMPNMSGGEVYDQMKRINPNVKVLLSSGYSIDGEATQILERGCDGFIQKPFKTKQLHSKIREILEGNKGF